MRQTEAIWGYIVKRRIMSYLLLSKCIIETQKQLAIGKANYDNFFHAVY